MSNESSVMQRVIPSKHDLDSEKAVGGSVKLFIFIIYEFFKNLSRCHSWRGGTAAGGHIP